MISLQLHLVSSISLWMLLFLVWNTTHWINRTLKAMFLIMLLWSVFELGTLLGYIIKL